MAVQQWSDDTLVVRLTGDLELSDDFDQVAACLRAATLNVIVDLSGLGLLNSSGLARLLMLRKRVLDAGRRLVLCGPSDEVWGIFLSTGLDSVFEFDEDLTTALARLQGGST